MIKVNRYVHLNDKKRDRLQALKDAGHLQKDIAHILKVNSSTVSREIRKRKKQDGVYDAGVAEHKAGILRSNSKYQGMKIEKYPEVRSASLLSSKMVAHPMR